MTALRILQIAHDHPDWVSGGTEYLAHDLSRALDARDGVVARFLAASSSLIHPDAIPGSLHAEGKDLLLHIGAYDRFSMLRQDGIAWLDALAKVLQALRPHIVHLHGLDRLGAEILPALRRLAPRCRIVLTLHDYQLICPNDGLMLTTRDHARCDRAQDDACHRCFPQIAAARHALRRAHLLAALECADAIVAPSEFLREKFFAWGLAPDRIRLIRNAVATPRPAIDPRRGRSRRDRFAFFGNIAAHKGVDVLLAAAARLRATDSDLRVILHGGLGWAEEPFRNAFACALEAAGPNAQHLGPYARRDVAALMQQADWIIVPSKWWENAPLVILEARAAGRPVICTGHGGMAELVRPGFDGLHTPPGDAAALADLMREVAEKPDLWTRLARSAGRGPDYSAFVNAHLALYASLSHRIAA